MYYYAELNPASMVCVGVSAHETEQATYAYLIQIDSYDESLVYRKKYIDGEWVDATPDEAAIYDAHLTKCNGKWLDELTGDTEDLNTTDKTSLVAAINELVSRVAALEVNNAN